jgi:hypothetical protein
VLAAQVPQQAPVAIRVQLAQIQYFLQLLQQAAEAAAIGHIHLRA